MNVLCIYHRDPDSIIAAGMYFKYFKSIYGKMAQIDMYEAEYDSRIPMKSILNEKSYSHAIVIGMPINWYTARAFRNFYNGKNSNITLSAWIDNHVSSEDFLEDHKFLRRYIGHDVLRIHSRSLTGMVFLYLIALLGSNHEYPDSKFFKLMDCYATEIIPYSKANSLDFITGLENAVISPTSIFDDTEIFYNDGTINREWEAELINKYINIGLSMRDPITWSNTYTHKYICDGIFEPNGQKFDICVVNAEYNSNTFASDVYMNYGLYVAYRYNGWVYEYTIISNDERIDCYMIAASLCNYADFESYGANRATFRSDHLLFKENSSKLRIITKNRRDGETDIIVKITPWWRRFI